MAHVAERLSSHYLPAVLAFEVTTTAVPQHAIDIVQRVRPNFFFSPPRLWEKMRAGLLVALEREGRRAEFDPVYARALQRTRREFAGESVRADDEPIEGEEVLAEMRRRLAFESLSFAMVGSAPCPPDVIEFFHSLGVRLVEVYGMTEEAGIATANPPNAVRLGTVGPPIPGVEVRLAVDGEVLIRGDNIMIGYRNMPDETAEAVDSEGWLHSGDIGAFDDDGYLKIVDRKKEIIISAAGKNMSPTHIEATLKAASPLIGQACVIGDAQPYNVALLTLEPAEASSLANRLGLSTAEELVEAPAVIDLVRQGVRDANEKLARVEQIKRFVVLASEWVPASDELTPTMKLKRRPIVEKYACEIEALYAGDAPACCVGSRGAPRAPRSRSAGAARP
jgi:long-subunit acyl-CoA synthetase (AMP-forming)